MRRILFGIVMITSFVSIRECSFGETEFQYCIRNERSTSANVRIRTAAGNTVTINDIQPGQTTDFRSASVGIVVATAYIENELVSPSATLYGKKNSRSTLVIETGKTPLLEFH